MVKDFRGKNVVVTGGGSGIGRALIHAFVREGAKIAFTDISQERIDAVAGEFRDNGITVVGYRVDHSSEEATRNFANQVLADFGHVDVVCANAGIGGGGQFEKTGMDEWRRMIDINLLGVVYTFRYLVPSIIKRGMGGALMVTASGAALVPGPGSACYHMTKAAVASLGQTLSAELAVHNIGVSILCPGIIKTGITDVGATVIQVGDEKSEQAAMKELFDFYARKGVSPDIVAADALRGLKKNALYILSPTSHVRLGWLIQRLAPSLFNRLVALPRWRKGQLVSGARILD